MQYMWLYINICNDHNDYVCYLWDNVMIRDDLKKWIYFNYVFNIRGIMSMWDLISWSKFFI